MTRYHSSWPALRKLQLCLVAQDKNRSLQVCHWCCIKYDAYVIITYSCARNKQSLEDLLIYSFCPL